MAVGQRQLALGLGAQRAVPAELLLGPQLGDRLGHPGVEPAGALALLGVQRGAVPDHHAGPSRHRPVAAARHRGVRAAQPDRDQWHALGDAQVRRPSRSGDIQPSSLRVPSGKSSRLQPLASRYGARLRSRRDRCRSTGNALNTSAVTTARTRASKK
ncbi:hypothetical protein Prum_083400 [Phytohabitans rumicis]|uniref:Uncharacterized protein n=1 Tax=Phytohabitans rumicis TaxID=1076125 RepID=A0A6V8LIM7_9ACTN|nr:hypothetical protein [Phytohabitans rumicis]GFJ94698.1 hypothetical protein Prum_083400 [Phytohabitans rumicis]